MRKTLIAAASLALLLAACGKTHDSQDGAAPTPPADAPADAPASAPPPAAASEFDGDINAAGTEPFWAVEIRAARITLKRPDHPDLALPNPGVKVTGETAIWDGSGDNVRLTVAMEKKPCSDGMSDRAYPYVASVKVGEEVLKGCAIHPADAEAQPKP